MRRVRHAKRNQPLLDFLGARDFHTVEGWVYFEGERLQVRRVVVVVWVDEQEFAGLEERLPPGYASRKKVRVDGAFVDVEERDVAVDRLVQQDDELDDVRIGLLPEGLLPRPKRLVSSKAMP